MLVTKKTAVAMGLSIHDGVGSKVSVFARRQMEKMGWEEGKGLGKNETGISKHIKAVKRDDSSGLGLESAQAAEQPDNWWHDAFSKNLKTFSSSSGGKKKRSKKSENSEAEAPPSYAELFAATGGARLGMRARASQKGKLLRTEGSSTEETSQPLPDDVLCADDSVAPKMKKKKSKTTHSVEEEESEIVVEPIHVEIDTKEKSKKKKSKSTHSVEEEESEIIVEIDTKEKSRKKKSKSSDL